jgi:hypothetical protein
LASHQKVQFVNTVLQLKLTRLLACCLLLVKGFNQKSCGTMADRYNLRSGSKDAKDDSARDQPKHKDKSDVSLLDVEARECHMQQACKIVGVDTPHPFDLRNLAVGLAGMSMS